MRRSAAVIVFVLAVGSLAAPVAADAQLPAKVQRIGYLTPSKAGDISAAFRQTLQQLGYVEGQNVVIEGRFAEGKLDRLPDLAAELVRLKVDVIVTITTPGAMAAKNATTTIPVVMSAVDQPVERGLVASLARPGGNVTGVTHNPGPDFITKQLQLLREVAPKASRLAFVWDSTNLAEVAAFKDVESAARAVGLTLIPADVRSREDYGTAFAAVTKERGDALFATPSNLNGNHAKLIADFAARNRLPTIFSDREFVDAGGLMSYYTDWTELRRRTAAYVDKILKGAKPADLPIEQPTRFELIINLKTAKALGLAIPQSVLVLADEVIQ